MAQTDTHPLPISLEEWQEIASLPEVREAWGITDEIDEYFARVTYGAKFNFVTGGPGYAGDLYILQDDALGGVPWRIIRKNGKLTLI